MKEPIEITKSLALKEEKYGSEKHNPIEFFKSKKDDLFKAIDEGLTNFLKKEPPCCLYFFSNKSQHTKQIDEIKLMIAVGFDIDVLEKSENFFSKKATYLSSVTDAISKVAEDHFISFNPPLNTNNITSFLLELGKIYSKSKETPIEDDTYNKLATLLEQYKIFFSIDPSNPDCIVSLPLQETIKSPIPIVTIVSVINLIFKDKSMLAWSAQKTRRITISSIDRTSLTTLQTNLVKKSKQIMKRYLDEKLITIQSHDSTETLSSDPEPSEETELKQDLPKFIVCKTIHAFKIAEKYIQENFGHYCFQLQHYTDLETSDGYCYFKIINLQIDKHESNQSSFIDFLSSLHHPIDESPLKFAGLDPIISIVENYTVGESIGLKFFLADNPTDSKSPPSYILRVPMSSRVNMNTCESKVDYALKVLRQDSKLNLEVQSKPNQDKKNSDGVYRCIRLLWRQPEKIEKNTLYLTIQSVQNTHHKSISVQVYGLVKPKILDNQEIKEVFRVLNEEKPNFIIPSSITTNGLVRKIATICGFTPAIEFSSNNKSILLMLELDIRGLKLGFMKLFTQYKGINEYEYKKGGKYHLVAQTDQDETLSWKAESSSARYLQLIKKVNSHDGWHSLYEIEKLLGPDFDVVLEDGLEWKRSVEPRFVEPPQPRPSFFSSSGKSKDAKISRVVDKLKRNQAIGSAELSLLNQSRPIQGDSTILIRGFNEHDTQLLEICYAIYYEILVKDALKVTELPDDPIKKIIMSYFTQLEDQTESILPTLSM